MKYVQCLYVEKPSNSNVNKVDQGKWRDIPCSWVENFSVMK